MLGGDKRTRSDKRLRPVRWEISRYGILERTLKAMRGEDVKEFGANDIAIRTRNLSPDAISGLLKSVNGVDKIGKNIYIFNGDDIEVGGKWIKSDMDVK